MTVTDAPTRIISKGAQRATVRNTGETTVYAARTAAQANETDGFPVFPGEGLWIDGPLYVACAADETGEIKALLPA
jgi:hypothetical protein